MNTTTNTNPTTNDAWKSAIDLRGDNGWATANNTIKFWIGAASTGTQTTGYGLVAISESFAKILGKDIAEALVDTSVNGNYIDSMKSVNATDVSIEKTRTLMNNFVKSVKKTVSHTQTVDEMNARLAEISTELKAIQALPDDERLSNTNIDIISNLIAEDAKLRAHIEQQTPAASK